MDYPTGNTGKAFEFASARALSDAGIGFLDDRALAKQKLDQKAFENLNPSQRRYLISAAHGICDWLLETHVPYSEISRPNDSAGEDGDPGDLVLSNASGRISISLKHDNPSIKHHRPSNLARQCGFASDDSADLNWRDKFFTSVSGYLSSRHPSARQVATDIVDSAELYNLVTDLVLEQIEEWLEINANLPETLYKFLVGPEELVTALATPKLLKVTHWDFDRRPVRLEISKISDKLVLEFSNGHTLTWRVHTASSLLSIDSPSLKWDVRSLQEPRLIFRKIFDKG